MDALALWQRMYLLIWLAFAQFLLAALTPFVLFLIDLHSVIGLAVLGLAHINYSKIKKTLAPNRLKRISKVTAILATVQPLIGLILYLNLRLGFPLPFFSAITTLHLVIGLAIISQASSTATAYDMWEDKEFA